MTNKTIYTYFVKNHPIVSDISKGKQPISNNVGFIRDTLVGVLSLLKGTTGDKISLLRGVSVSNERFIWKEVVGNLPSQTPSDTVAALLRKMKFPVIH
jgi:hypothetical protein